MLMCIQPCLGLASGCSQIRSQWAQLVCFWCEHLLACCDYKFRRCEHMLAKCGCAYMGCRHLLALCGGVWRCREQQLAIHAHRMQLTFPWQLFSRARTSVSSTSMSPCQRAMICQICKQAMNPEDRRASPTSVVPCKEVCSRPSIQRVGSLS